MKINNHIRNRIQELCNTKKCREADFIMPKIRLQDCEFEFAMNIEAKELLVLADKELNMSEAEYYKLERIVLAIMSIDNATGATAPIMAEAISYIK